jgi:hypothetical protein
MVFTILRLSAELIRGIYTQTEWDEPCQIITPSLTLPFMQTIDYKVFVVHCYFEGPENHAYINFGSPHIIRT